MHGRVKVRTTAEQEEIKKLERQKKSAKFRIAINCIFEKRKKKEYDDTMLSLTAKLLIKHPDVYTLWNIRQDCFMYSLYLYKWSDEEYFDRIKQELSLTECCLKENPKSYSVWHYRRWVFNELPSPNKYEKELELCNKYLDYDERNFHCWDYRSRIVEKANISDEEELEFTYDKILKNFSNYSAWHYRSRLLKKLYPSNVHDLPIRSDKHDEELDLIMDATFTDPKDSSAWFYQSWLLDYWKLPSKLWQVVLTNNSVTVAFHKEVPLEFELFVNGKKIKCNWKSVNGKKFSVVWQSILEESCSTLIIHDNNSEIILIFEENQYSLKKSNKSDEWIYKSNILNRNHINTKIKGSLDKYKELLQMEPSNKWVRLNNAYLMFNLNPIELHSEIIKELQDLITIDPLRANYYKDMRSKRILEYKFNNIVNYGNTNEVIRTIDLSNLELTSLYSQEPYMAFFYEINFSNNHLGDKLHQLYTLQQCQKLDLSNNSVSSLKKFPKLSNLKVLLLSDNKISDSEEIFILLKRHTLEKLELERNPISNVDSLLSEIKNLFPNLQVVF